MTVAVSTVLKQSDSKTRHSSSPNAWVQRNSIENVIRTTGNERYRRRPYVAQNPSIDSRKASSTKNTQAAMLGKIIQSRRIQVQALAETRHVNERRQFRCIANVFVALVRSAFIGLSGRTGKLHQARLYPDFSWLLKPDASLLTSLRSSCRRRSRSTRS